MAKIFNLNVDCFEALFDYLDREDLHAFAQTCKRSQQVIDHYHQQCMSADLFWCGDRKSIGFSKYAKSACATGGYISELRKIDWDAFESVENITLYEFDFESTTVLPDSLLRRLKVLTFDWCKTAAPTITRIVTCCQNIKSLKIRNDHNTNTWFEQPYPNQLEHFEWMPNSMDVHHPIDNLKTFFGRNPFVYNHH